MPIVQIDMLEGRTVEQRREMVKRITQDIAETANCPESAVKVIIREMNTTHFGEGGKLRADL